MRIESVSTTHSRIPLLEGSWGDTIHHVTHLELIIAEIATDTGLVGTGYTYTSGYGGASIRAMIDADLALFVIGKPASPRGIWQQCWMHLHDEGGGGVTSHALAAIDVALWDLVAREVERPLVDVLGRCRDTIPTYASGINLHKSLEELLDQVRRWVKEGYTAYKVKVGKPDLDEDVERLTKVREVIGARRLMVDANQGWTVGEAARAIKAFEPLSLTWVEEPLLADDVEGHARLRSLVHTPIATGENVYTLQQFNHFLMRGGCDFVQADVLRVGGITPYLEIAALARAWNVPLAPHFAMEITGSVLCALANAYILENIDGGALTRLKALSEPIEIEDGTFTPPELPGHGIKFNRDYLLDHAVS